MKAMILAAGLGTRLRPLTDALPKPLVTVAGRPLITYNLMLLRRYGVTDVIINLHHHGDALRAALGDGSAFGLRIVYSPEESLLDTGGALKNAEPLLGNEDAFLVMNGDTIIDLALDRLLDAHRTRDAMATLVLRRDPDQQRYGVIEIDAADRVRRFLGQPTPGAGGLRPFMFAGVHALSPRVFAHMRAGTAFSMTRTTYPQLLAAGKPLYGLPYDGFWRVIDTPEDLAQATEALTTGTPLRHLGVRG